jgi:hypothetical protein
MISGLIDELNKSADEWNGSNMFELARMCRDAADTITELRGALQVASVDYRHLQDELWRVTELKVKADFENAKLRELVDGLEYCVQGLVCDCCPLYDPSSTDHRRCESLERELGIEVEA